jgi:hypothetical protein
MTSPWIPGIYVEYETTDFRTEGKRVAVRVKKTGTVIRHDTFFADEARRVIALFQAAGVRTHELKLGEPEEPWFI